MKNPDEPPPRRTDTHTKLRQLRHIFLPFSCKGGESVFHTARSRNPLCNVPGSELVAAEKDDLFWTRMRDQARTARSLTFITGSRAGGFRARGRTTTKKNGESETQGFRPGAVGVICHRPTFTGSLRRAPRMNRAPTAPLAGSREQSKSSGSGRRVCVCVCVCVGVQRGGPALSAWPLPSSGEAA